MKWTWVVALLVVASTAGAAIQTDGSDCPVEIGESDEPGAELANVVGAQESVVAREIERRGFNATLANASDPEERATVVATELERIEVRLTTLETCRDALVEAREDGDLSGEEYRERAGTLESDIVDARERLNRSAAAASDLPPAVRAENNIETERFENMAVRVADLEAFVTSPDRAIESVDDSDEGETTPADSTAGESTSSEPTDVQPTTTDDVSDRPDETTPPSTETATETPTVAPTPTTEPPNDETQDDESDGADESDGDWPLGPG